MDKYTKFILSIIAVSLIVINIQLMDKNEINLISKAHAVESHDHDTYDIWDLAGFIENCRVREGAFNSYESGSFGNTWKIRC